MAQGIDFLAAVQKKAPIKAQTSHWLRLGSIVLLVGYCLLVGAIFSYSVFLRAETEKVAEQISEKTEAINSFKKIETLQTILKERLAGLNKYFSQEKTDFSQMLTYFEGIAAGGINFEQMNFNGEGEISLSGTAVNSLVLSRLLETLSEPGQTDSFSQISLGSVSRRPEGIYNFNLIFSLNEKQ